MKVPARLRKHAKKARKQGWHIQYTRGGHIVWVAPDGYKVYSASTGCKGRGDANHLARMKQHGYKE